MEVEKDPFLGGSLPWHAGKGLERPVWLLAMVTIILTLLLRSHWIWIRCEGGTLWHGRTGHDTITQGHTFLIGKHVSRISIFARVDA